MKYNDLKIINISSFISSLGDYIALFAFFSYLHLMTGSLAIASSTILIEYFGKFFSNLLYPLLSKKINSKDCFKISHFVAGFVTFVFGIQVFFESNTFYIYILLQYLLLVIASEVFDATRELHTKKEVSVPGDHLTVQAQMMGKIFQAQFLGPILSYFLISYAPGYMPFFINGASFFICFCLSFFLRNSHISSGGGFLKSFVLLKEKSHYVKPFLTRTFGTKVFIAISNTLVFSVILKAYNLNPINSVWTYCAIGLGSMVATSYLGNLSTQNKFEKKKVLLFLFLVYSLTEIAFLTLHSFALALLVISVQGVSNGGIAALTRAWRKVVYTKSDFAQMISLENCFGLLLQAIVTGLTVLFISLDDSFYIYGMIFCSIWIVLTGLYAFRHVKV